MTKKTTQWSQLKQDLNNWGHLDWLTEDPSSKTNYLDLTLEIQGNLIIASTYQKAMNLYQYIPPLSAHPPS